MISVYNFPYLLRQSVLDLKPNAFIETGCKTLTVDEMIGYIISYKLTPEQEQKIRDRFGITGKVTSELPKMGATAEELQNILERLVKIKTNVENNNAFINKNLIGGNLKKQYFIEQKLLSNYTNMDKLNYIMKGGATVDEVNAEIGRIDEAVAANKDLLNKIRTKIEGLTAAQASNQARIEQLTRQMSEAQTNNQTKIDDLSRQIQALQAERDQLRQQAALGDKGAQENLDRVNQQLATAIQERDQARTDVERLNRQLTEARQQSANEFTKILERLQGVTTAVNDINTQNSNLTGGAILKKLDSFFTIPKYTGGMDARKLRDNYHMIKQYISKNSGIYNAMVGGNADIMGLGMQGINNYSDMRNLMAQSLAMTQQPMPMNSQQMIPALFQQYSNQLLQNDPLRAAIMQQIPAMKFQ
jgi:DNA repair exonuclease SbcCD ATPase subunit